MLDAQGVKTPHAYQRLLFSDTNDCRCGLALNDPAHEFLPNTPAQLITLSHDLTKCRWRGIPVLRRSSDNSMLGAYCPADGGWIKWVRQTDPWLALEESQRASAGVKHDEDPLESPYSSIDDRVRAALNYVARECYAISDDHGWHDTPRSTLERAMLVVTELSELSESARNDTLQNSSAHIPPHTQAAEEWADVLVRVFDHAPEDGVTHEQLVDAFLAKIEFNRSRPYRHGGKTI